jgi:hypothetical protein
VHRIEERDFRDGSTGVFLEIPLTPSGLPAGTHYACNSILMENDFGLLRQATTRMREDAEQNVTQTHAPQF